MRKRIELRRKVGVKEEVKRYLGKRERKDMER